MYLLTHSLSPVLVLVAVMKPKELKTKISHANPLTLSHFLPSLARMVVCCSHFADKCIVLPLNLAQWYL